MTEEHDKPASRARLLKAVLEDDGLVEEGAEAVFTARAARPLTPTELRNVIEGAILAAAQPLNLARIQALFIEGEIPEREAVLEAIRAIESACVGRGFELKEVASGWRFQVRAESAPWVNRLYEEKPQRYSRALLETLALIAYRQPITRGEIEEIRGVAVSSNIIRTLVEREWVKVVGHRDVPGRPALFATTRLFLDYFNLKSLEQLPSLGEISDLEALTPELDLMPEIPLASRVPLAVEDEDADRGDSGEELAATEADFAGAPTVSPADVAADTDVPAQNSVANGPTVAGNLQEETAVTRDVSSLFNE
jgi:segregation and condensation protein B